MSKPILFVMMSQIDPNIALEVVAAAVTAIGGVYTVIKAWVKHAKVKKEAYKQDILLEARNEADKFRAEVEVRIQKIEIEVETQKESIYKDIGYLKESHTVEIRNLTEKIENLREDLKAQHSSILSLLTKLIDTK
jgi:hypothetical protein